MRVPGFNASTALSFLMMLTLVGCAGYGEIKHAVEDSHRREAQHLSQAHPPLAPPKREGLVERLDTLWVSGHSVAREKGEELPPQFQQVTLNFRGRHNIASVAEIIHRATGLKVLIHPDVFASPLTLANSRPSSGSAASAALNPATSTAPTAITTEIDERRGPGATSNSILTTSGGDYYLDVPVNFVGALSDFLDQISIRLGIDWDYRGGRIEFRRLVTRSFNVVSLPGRHEISTSLGKQGGVSAGNRSSGNAPNTSNGQFSSSMNVSAQAQVDYWAALEGVVKTILSPLGRYAINQGSGTVTVTDTRDVIERIGAVLEEENRAMTRQVAFDVQVYSLRTADGADFGIDWNLVYQQLSSLAPDWQLGVTSPGSLVSPTAGSYGVQILKKPSSDGGGLNRLSGSQALVRALANTGKLSMVTSNRVVTTNRKAVPVASTDQLAYVAQTTPVTTNTASGTAISIPGLTPGIVTTGFIMSLVPTLIDRNALMLSFSLDLSDLRALGKFTSGSGVTEQSVQLPDVSGKQSSQNVVLRSGETVVITGFEQSTHRYDEATLGREVSAGLGGSFTGQMQKESLIIMITPLLLEGV